MLSKTFLLALAAAPFVAAHGKVATVTGDAGGNGTALAIQGGVVPGPGPNRKVNITDSFSNQTKERKKREEKKRGKKASGRLISA